MRKLPPGRPLQGVLSFQVRSVGAWEVWQGTGGLWIKQAPTFLHPRYRQQSIYGATDIDAGRADFWHSGAQSLEFQHQVSVQGRGGLWIALYGHHSFNF